MPDSPLQPRSFAAGRFELLDWRERPGAVDFKVRVARGGERVSRRLLRALEAERPTLREHACTADDTGEAMTLPHLLEHVAIDLLVEWGANADGAPIAGYTVWLDRRAGLARITLSSADGAITGAGMLAACELVAQYSD